MLGTSVTVFVLFYLRERMMNTLLALTPGFKVAFVVKTVILGRGNRGTK